MPLEFSILSSITSGNIHKWTEYDNIKVGYFTAHVHLYRQSPIFLLVHFSYLHANVLCYCTDTAKQREGIKRVLTTVNQCSFFLSTEGSLVDTRAYQPYTLAGPTSIGLVETP